MVYSRLLADDSWVPSAGELPDVVSPSGLSEERQWYLHDQIREFCIAGTEDLACPLPAVPRPSHPVTAPEEEEEAPRACVCVCVRACVQRHGSVCGLQ